MLKFHYFSNNFFIFRQALGALCPQNLAFNIGGLKFCDLANCCFSSWLWLNRLSKKLWRYFRDVISMHTSPKNVINNTSKIFFNFPNQNFWLR